MLESQQGRKATHKEDDGQNEVAPNKNWRENARVLVLPELGQIIRRVKHVNDPPPRRPKGAINSKVCRNLQVTEISPEDVRCRVLRRRLWSKEIQTKAKRNRKVAHKRYPTGKNLGKEVLGVQKEQANLRGGPQKKNFGSFANREDDANGKERT